MPDTYAFRNVTLEEWEARQMKSWRFRLACAATWLPYYAWPMFRMWLWKRMHGPDDG